MDRERGERASLESMMRDSKREVGELQSRYDAHSAELNARWVSHLTLQFCSYKYPPLPRDIALKTFVPFDFVFFSLCPLKSYCSDDLTRSCNQ